MTKILNMMMPFYVSMVKKHVRNLVVSIVTIMPYIETVPVDTT